MSVFSNQDNIINDAKLSKGAFMIGIGVGKLTRQLLEWDPGFMLFVIF